MRGANFCFLARQNNLVKVNSMKVSGTIDNRCQIFMPLSIYAETNVHVCCSTFLRYHPSANGSV